MKNQNSHYDELLIHEMQLRNYSSRTIRFYSEFMSKAENFYSLSDIQITSQQCNDHFCQSSFYRHYQGFLPHRF